eukprot:1495486-Pyramimonas_sp.AAC.1
MGSHRGTCRKGTRYETRQWKCHGMRQGTRRATCRGNSTRDAPRNVSSCNAERIDIDAPCRSMCCAALCGTAMCHAAAVLYSVVDRILLCIR